ncbi:MAG: hypothetical protein JNM12_02505 [Alphaproteobacteria bacterium]|nr:hypothetical protein [Alphaproteobacteria bacterium]
MTLDEFRNNVDIYSADLSRWPQALVKPAVAFMKDNAEAAALFERQLAADAQLRAHTPRIGDISALEARIMQGIAEQSSASAPAQAAVAAKPFWKPSWVFAPSGGLMVVALIGYLAGFNPQPKHYVPLDPSYVAEEQVLASADTYTYGANGEIY